MFADIIVDISIDRSEKTYQYRIPDELSEKVSTGTVVEIYFGNRKKPVKGFVVGLSQKPKLDESKIKDIANVPQNALPIEGRLIALAGWMRKRYGGSMNAALNTVLPVKKSVRPRKVKNPYADIKRSESVVSLNPAQRQCVDTFVSDYESSSFKKYLLFGVTGSGKTEVYFGMIDAVLAQNRSVIVLIPEISLTYQTLSRFFSRFGDIVSVMHSKLSAGERYEQFERAKSGDIRIMIGPRSALFTPFCDLGLIIIDEEHDGAYKSEKVPRYHSREVAEWRAADSGASLVLGSATPSLVTYTKAMEGEYRLLVLNERATKRSLPVCTVIDLKEELKSGNRSPLSRVLYERMSQALAKKEQIILFLNRRGLSGFVSCRACSHVIKCPHCDVSLSLHRGGRLKCHYCGYETAAPKVCPKCGSKYIGAFKAGTQRIEALVKNAFPDAGVLRMDADTTSGKGGHEAILKAFASRSADILIGTQMIVKGHDFPGVSLVGIIAADMSLNSSDYLGAERTFQLIVQASGRAGRGEVPGEVIIQSYDPAHYAITAAAAADYRSFYRQEMSYRSMMMYPPVSHMLRIQILESSAERVKALADRVRAQAETFGERLRIVGPSEASLFVVKDTWRMAVYIKHDSIDTLIKIKNHIEQMRVTRGNVSFDFDPTQSF